MSPAAPTGAVAALGPPFVAADRAFYAVFAVFVVAFAVLAVITVRWAVRRDRAGRAEWARRQSAAGPTPGGVPGTQEAGRAGARGAARGAPGASPGPQPTGPETRANGHVPRRRDPRGGRPRRER